MDIYVQSFLNSASTLTVSVTTSTTISQLKTLVSTAEGVTTTVMAFYFNNDLLANTGTIGLYGITAGSRVGSSNTIASLPTKEQRQIAKLELAQLRRQAGGNTSTNYYREFNIYNRDLLAAKYVGNTATNISNTLTNHRPWTS